MKCHQTMEHSFLFFWTRVLPSLEALLSTTDEGRRPSTGQTEAEDPLDAYMKSSDRESDSVSKSNTKLNSNNRGEKRMDIQMEEDEDLSEELVQSKRNRLCRS